MLVMAFLAVLFSNACHVIAMQHVQSNTAALLNATPALWIAWLGTFGPRTRPLSGAQQARAPGRSRGRPADPRAQGRIPRRRPRLAAR